VVFEFVEIDGAADGGLQFLLQLVHVVLGQSEVVAGAGFAVAHLFRSSRGIAEVAAAASCICLLLFKSQALLPMSTVRYSQGADPMILPSSVTFAKQQEINAAVSEVVKLLAPDVVHIRYHIGQDWSGDWAIFFRVLLSDEASKTRLREVTTQVVWRLAERLDFPSMGLFPYHNFRSESEQAVLREETWA